MKNTHPILDAHMHVAGIGAGGSGCFIHPRTLNSIPFRLMRWYLGLTERDVHENLEKVYAAKLVSFLRDAPSIRQGLIFAHDAIFSADGTQDDERTQLYVPNEYVLALARNHPELLPVASVHPHRRDGLERVQACIEAGARALKWLPNSQGMNPSNRSFIPLYDFLASRGIPLICHTGGEHTVKVLDPALSDPKLLQLPLERGVTVICAHCATHSGFIDKDYFEDFAAMALRWPNCYGDTSALAAPIRAHYLPRLVEREELHPKLIHGTDFPVPSYAFWLIGRMPFSQVRSLDRIGNPLERDVQIKKAVGLPDVVFQNAERVFLPNFD